MGRKRRTVIALVALVAMLAPAHAKAIVGGSRADYGAYRFAAAILVKGEIRCTGSVIAPRWVLTAAHCVDEGVNVARTTVRVGSNNRKKNGTVIPVVEFVAHPKFNSDELLGYDVALLRLARAVPGGVSTIRLASAPGDDHFERDGRQLTVIGWGAHLPLRFNPGLDPMLWETRLDVVGDQECYGESSSEHALVAICAQRLLTSPCYGDSGGPLFGRVGNSYVQVGTLSNILVTCGGAPLPVEFAEVNNPSVRSFIRQHSGV